MGPGRRAVDAVRAALAEEFISGIFWNTVTTVSRKRAREVLGVEDYLCKTVHHGVTMSEVMNVVEESQIAMVEGRTSEY